MESLNKDNALASKDNSLTLKFSNFIKHMSFDTTRSYAPFAFKRALGMWNNSF